MHRSHGKIVYFIVGPTAVGKTDVAAELAIRLGTSIISADSRQCYREMTIGTAKPSMEIQQRVKHYFVDVFPVARSLSAADFESMALQYLAAIFESADSAVVCGGTGLYVKALAEGLDDMPEPDEAIVKQVGDTYKAQGLGWLQAAVASEDPEFYKTAEIHNPARLLRALTFVRSAGQSITAFRSGKIKGRPFNMVKVGLELPRDVLYERINMRVDDMMRSGLLAEVQQLFPLRSLKNLHTVGYAELFEYMEGKYLLPEAVDKIKQHTRNFAKRQMTWFRKDPSISWLSADDPDVVDKILALQPR